MQRGAMDASIWVMFISKYSDTLEIDFISGQLILLTNSIHKIPGLFVNKPGKKTLQ